MIDDKYPIPRIDDLYAKLSGGKRFSKIDLSSAYQQIVLDPDCAKVTTISTHKGLFYYSRLPFGVSCAPGQFQRLMDQLFTNVNGVSVFLDDILITGKDDREHIENLESVLNILKDNNLTVKPEKCKFFAESISYLGYDISEKGLHKSKNKLEAISKIPEPQNVSQLRSFIGAINYYNRFIPNIPTLLHPLYELIKKDVKWNWSRECQESFVKVKNILISDTVLVHFDSVLPLVLTVDASDYGVGAVLSHIFENGVERPICFASKTLTDQQKRWSQIDKESFAIIFGIKRFYQYLFGNKFTLVTDNKALVTIFGPKKGIPTMAANRLQRYACFLSGFNFDIKYVQTKNNIADFLSRLPVHIAEVENDDSDALQINYLTEASDLNLNLLDIERALHKDNILSKIITFVKSGWPKQTKDSALKPYFRKKEEINIVNNVLVWGHRVIIPESFQSRVLEMLHNTHMGIVKMKSLARSYVWWPNLNNDIEGISKSCNICQTFQRNVNTGILQSWPIENYPWNRIHIDYMGPIKGKYCLIVIDAFSKWLEVFLMSSITSEQTIDRLRGLFSRYGLPKTLCSDNGTQFTSHEFKNFLTQNNVTHITSPTYHAASNGAAENSVKTVKNFLIKELNTCNNVINLNRSLDRFLMMYRMTEHCSTGESPSRLFLGRQIRSRFDLIRPDNVNILPKNTSEVIDNLKKSQDRNQKYFKGKREEIFTVGQCVFAKDYRNIQKPIWTICHVIKVLGKNVYLVKVHKSDLTWKRHQNQLRQCETHTQSGSVSESVSVVDESLELDEKADESETVPSRQSSSNNSSVRTSLLIHNRPQRTRKSPDRLRYD